jgi:hypothetical protein
VVKRQRAAAAVDAAAADVPWRRITNIICLDWKEEDRCFEKNTNQKERRESGQNTANDTVVFVRIVVKV